jgi:hypothetical protein
MSRRGKIRVENLTATQWQPQLPRARAYLQGHCQWTAVLTVHYPGSINHRPVVLSWLGCHDLHATQSRLVSELPTWCSSMYFYWWNSCQYLRTGISRYTTTCSRASKIPTCQWHHYSSTTFHLPMAATVSMTPLVFEFIGIVFTAILYGKCAIQHLIKMSERSVIGFYCVIFGLYWRIQLKNADRRAFYHSHF